MKPKLTHTSQMCLGKHPLCHSHTHVFMVSPIKLDDNDAMSQNVNYLTITHVDPGSSHDLSNIVQHRREMTQMTASQCKIQQQLD